MSGLTSVTTTNTQNKKDDLSQSSTVLCLKENVTVLMTFCFNLATNQKKLNIFQQMRYLIFGIQKGSTFHFTMLGLNIHFAVTSLIYCVQS